MPGAGGLLAANYLYNSAARDGTVLAIMNNGSPLFQTFDADNARYDAGKLNWIGTIAPITEDLVAWHTAPVKSFADLLTTELIIGTTGKGNTSYMIPVARNDDDRATFRIFAATARLGRPLVTTPDVPPDRLEALQAAFAAMMTDQAFIAEATKLQIEIAPVGPGEMRKLVESILSTPKPIIARLKAIVD
jgi:tripartite-type tricarboxylate transporter receptor subunit TctC